MYVKDFEHDYTEQVQVYLRLYQTAIPVRAFYLLMTINVNLFMSYLKDK